jgi:Tol biopolymer transport system component
MSLLLLAGLAAGAVELGAESARPSHVIDIRVSEGTWMNLDVSPDGREIAFDLLGDIFVVPVAGGEARLIRGGPAMDLHPRFSPDGRRIVFVSDADGDDNVWTMDRDGGDAKQLTHESVNLLASPDWTPDGRAIVARRSASTQPGYLTGDLVRYPVDGGTGTTLVTGTRFIDEPQVSFDGRWLYFSQGVTPATVIYRNPLEANVAVKRRDQTTGEVTEVARGFGSALAPRVSPDGGRLAYVRRVKTKSVLFVHDLKTGVQTPLWDGLTRDNQVNPAGSPPYPAFDWFPDNRHVAIWSGGKLWKIDTVTAERTEIPFTAHSPQKVWEPLRVSNPVAPDQVEAKAVLSPAMAGDALVFSALGHVWKKRGEGAPERIAASDDLQYEPALSADGRQTTWVEWNDETGARLVTAPLAGGKPRTVYAADAILRHPAFSPDGSRIAYSVDKPDTAQGGRAGERGLLLLDVKGGTPRLITRDGTRPRFIGDRIYFQVEADYPGGVVLKSARLDGSDPRDHASSSNGERIDISPDGRWFVLQEFNQIYLAPNPDVGTSVALSGHTTEVPLRKLSEVAGAEPHFSVDGKRVGWMLGGRHFSAPLDGGPTTSEPVGPVVPADKPSGVTAFVGARIITMHGAEVIEDGVLVVRDNRIEAVGPRGVVAPPPGAVIIDATGKTLMPGLFDVHAHVHLAVPRPGPQKFSPYYANLAFGVTTLFDPSADFNSYERAEAVRAGSTIGPRIYTSGPVVLGLSGSPPYAPISSLEDAKAQLSFRQAYGGMIAKSYMQPSRRQRREILEAASQLGMMVAPEGGLNFQLDLSMIIDGHTTVEHGIPLPEVYADVEQLLEGTKVALTPTLVVAAGAELGEQYFYQHERLWEDPRVQRYVPDVLDLFGGGLKPPYVRAMTTEGAPEEVYEAGSRAVARVHAKLGRDGVLINTGAHGQTHGLGLHWEMKLMSQGGMTNAEVLRAATINPATTLGLDRELGTLEVGKLADLIVLDGNPLQDIDQTRSVRMTMTNGRLYDSLSMDEIGLRPRHRSKFYWELGDRHGIDWNPSMIGNVRGR